MTTTPPTKPGRTLKLRPAKGWLRNPVTARATSDLTVRTPNVPSPDWRYQ